MARVPQRVLRGVLHGAGCRRLRGFTAGGQGGTHGFCQHKHIGGTAAVHGDVIGYSDGLEHSRHFQAVDGLHVVWLTFVRQPAHSRGIGQRLVQGQLSGLPRELRLLAVG